MKPLTFLFTATLVLPTFGKELTGTYLPSDNACPTPEQARAKMSVPEGYEVRCFAHEPMVQNPVAMTWDHRGRLWVVEAYEYPNGSPHPAPFGGEAKDDQYQSVPAGCLPTKNEEPGTKNLPRDRVIILEDTEQRWRGRQAHRLRAKVSTSPPLSSAVMMASTSASSRTSFTSAMPNGDDKPDAWRVVLTGFRTTRTRTSS